MNHLENTVRKEAVARMGIEVKFDGKPSLYPGYDLTVTYRRRKLGFFFESGGV